MSASSILTSSYNSSHYPCTDLPATSILSAFFAIKFLILVPLCVFILYLAYWRWRRQQRSFRSSSHCDVVTCHVAVLELICSSGTILYFSGVHFNLHDITIGGIYVYAVSYYGEALFHILTCVERYLAVVHPVTYLGLRNARGVRIRNVGVGCVWLLCFAWSSVTFHDDPAIAFISVACISGVSTAVISFCSLCILRVLIRPGPGTGGGDKERVNQSKQRAFFTIVSILGVLLFLFLWYIVTIALYRSEVLDEGVSCAVLASALWFTIPSSLVSPLLYLHRAGKLSCLNKRGRHGGVSG